MKKIIPILLFIVSISLIAYGGTDQSSSETWVAPSDDDFASIYINQGMYKGADWVKLNDKEKMTYVMAYQDGLVACSIFYIKDKKQQEVAIHSFPSGDIDKILKEMDVIYSDQRNIDIPIPYVLIAVRNKIEGAEQKSIEGYLEYIREKK